MANPGAVVRISLFTGFCFIFNLFLGSALITLPKVYQEIGWFGGALVLSVLASLSLKSYYDILECLSIANFLARTYVIDNSGVFDTAATANEPLDPNEIELVVLNRQPVEFEALPEGDPNDDGPEPEPNLSRKDLLRQQLAPVRALFEIDQKFEIGEMVKRFLGDWQFALFNVTMIAYLTGNVIIYNSMMSLALRELTCSQVYSNSLYGSSTNTPRPDDSMICVHLIKVTRSSAYGVYQATIFCIVLPIVYASSTPLVIKIVTWVQQLATYYRAIAVLIMILIPAWLLVSGQATGEPQVFEPAQTPNLIGTAIFAFMCQHSLPRIFVQIGDKSGLMRGSIFLFVIVLVIYNIISALAGFAFKDISNVYLMNFQPTTVPNPGHFLLAGYVLLVYPIFTLFSSYTVVGPTLSNTWLVMAQRLFGQRATSWAPYVCPILAMVIPLSISLFTEDVKSVVSLVGGLTGGFIQYVWPTALGYYSRKEAKIALRRFIVRFKPEVDISGVSDDELYFICNEYASPVGHVVWHVIVFIAWVVTLCLMIMKFFY